MRLKRLFAYMFALIILAGSLPFMLKTSFYANAESFTISNIWDTAGGGNISKDTNESFAKISLLENKYTAFKNTLAINDFKFVFQVSKTEFGELVVELKSDAPEYTGKSSVTNKVTFKKDANDIKVKVNDADFETLALTFGETYSEDILLSIVDGDVFVNSQQIGKLDEVKKQTATLTARNTASTKTEFLVKKINNQELEIDASHNIISTDKEPIIVIHDDLDGDFFVPRGLEYNFSFDAYDVLSSTVTTKLKYNKVGSEKVRESSNKMFVVINVDGVNGDEYELVIEATDKNENTATTGTYIITVRDDKDKPTIADETEFDYDAYQERVKKAAYSDFDNKKFVNLGSGEYYYIPNFDGMFIDSSKYSNMKFNLEYDTPTSQGRTLTKTAASSLKIELTAEGPYSFKIQAIDQLGNVSEDFSMRFSFVVRNTSGPRITAPATNDLGYLGASYTSSAFTISGIDTSAEYTLYYKAPNSQNYSLAEEELSGLTFTPNALGDYKISVFVYDSSGKTATAETFISINEKIRVIKGQTEWAKNNILSIIFLCTGSLSLIGIIVLLLVKPKEEEIEVIKKTDLK